MSSPPCAANANNTSATSRGSWICRKTRTFAAIIPLLPPDYRPLVQALVQENNELLARVHQRTRQNHLLLSHAVELMQQLDQRDFSRRKSEDL